MRGPKRWRDAGGTLLRAACVALLGASVASCGEGAATGPATTGQPVTGGWIGSGSLYQQLGWELVQHAPGDSLTGEGFMDAPNFLDGYPAGPNPRYRIRGERNGLFIQLLLIPEDTTVFPLRFEGVVQSNGEIKGEVFPGESEVRFDVIRVFRDARS